MHDAFVNICGTPTHIMTWGPWIEESLTGVKELVICITGNPGLPGYYTEFLGELHKNLGSQMPVWVIGHLGHDDPPPTSIREVPQLKGNEELFDLDGQIRHKLEFIRKYVPSDCKIHLIGHSIGAWMILQLLRHDDIRDRVARCYMLFPTVERMMESPNGWLFTKIAMPLYSVFGFIITLFNYLPEKLRIFLIYLYFLATNIPAHFLGTTLKYAKASVVEKVVFLAEDEMVRVCQLQRDIVRDNLPLLTFYYGTTDGWVPVQYYEAMLKEFPTMDVRLDTHRTDHAFVLRQSKSMAVIVRDMIADHSLVLGRRPTDDDDNKNL